MEEIWINGKALQVPTGMLLSKVLQENSDFKMPCSGKGHCGKCKVYAAGQLSEPDDVEKGLLRREELEGGIRLACRTRILGPARIAWKQPEEMHVLLGEQEVPGENRIFRTLGAAVDIGTTTLAGQLYNTKGLVAQAGCANPQGAFGADVISRIERSLAGEGELLAEAVRRGIDQLLTRMCLDGGYHPAEIDTVVITGNTTMLYLLTGRDAECLGHAPFQADWLADEWLSGADLRLSCTRARIWLPPCISAFVGADITMGLLAVDILHGKKSRLLVDIGTNGEIVLWKDGKLLCAATAAGPAFEGVGLSMGMQGEKGAISHVKLQDGSFQVEVIGQGSPCGICGSGVIDAVACLLDSGRLDETGYLEEEMAILSGSVAINQEDIRKVQLAKSATCAGIETLLHREGLCMDQLDELLVAGGFGAFLNLDSGRRIGLLPKARARETSVCGNTALKGAAKVLCNALKIEEAGRIATVAEVINLATDGYFTEKYLEKMFF